MEQKTRRIVPVPLASAGVAAYGDFVTRQDLDAILSACGVQVQDADIGHAASLLNDAASWFILGAQATASATDGEKAAWCAAVIERADALLACFDQADDGGDPVYAAGMVLRGPPDEFVIVDGLALDPRHDLHKMLDAADKLLRRALPA